MTTDPQLKTRSLFEKTFFSVLAANFCAMNLYMIFILYIDDSFKSESIWYQMASYFTAAVFFFAVGTLISFTSAVIIGWPLYWLAKKVGYLNCLTVSLGGIAIAIIPLVICKYTGWNIPDFSEKSGMVLILCLTFCGLIGGGVFCRLSKLKVPKPLKNHQP